VKVLVIGANGGIGRLLIDRLVEAGHQARAMVRREEQVADLEAAGAEVVIADLEGEAEPLEQAIAGADAVVFSAGSGAKTGPDKTLLIDLHGAWRTIDACERLGVDRYVMVSAMATDDITRGPEKIRHYLAAKAAADRLLMASDLDWTVVRPGGLTDDAATGSVAVGVPRLDERGSIPRADVASVLVTSLEDGRARGRVFEVVSGDTPIAELGEVLDAAG
jgi:uncharacterized protein YbjT (DUF2867 family)